MNLNLEPIYAEIKVFIFAKKKLPPHVGFTQGYLGEFEYVSGDVPGCGSRFSVSILSANEGEGRCKKIDVSVHLCFVRF